MCVVLQLPVRPRPFSSRKSELLADEGGAEADAEGGASQGNVYHGECLGLNSAKRAARDPVTAMKLAEIEPVDVCASSSRVCIHGEE